VTKEKVTRKAQQLRSKTRLRVVGHRLRLTTIQSVLRRSQQIRLEGVVHTTSLAGGFDFGKLLI